MITCVGKMCYTGALFKLAKAQCTDSVRIQDFGKGTKVPRL